MAASWAASWASCSSFGLIRPPLPLDRLQQINVPDSDVGSPDCPSAHLFPLAGPSQEAAEQHLKFMNSQLHLGVAFAHLDVPALAFPESGVLCFFYILPQQQL